MRETHMKGTHERPPTIFNVNVRSADKCFVESIYVEMLFEIITVYVILYH